MILFKDYVFAFKLVGFLRDCKLKGAVSLTYKKGSVHKLPPKILEEIQKQVPGAALDLTPKYSTIAVKNMLDNARLRNR